MNHKILLDIIKRCEELHFPCCAWKYFFNEAEIQNYDFAPIIAPL